MKLNNVFGALQTHGSDICATKASHQHFSKTIPTSFDLSECQSRNIQQVVNSAPLFFYQ